MTTSSTKLKSLTENIETIIRGKPQEINAVRQIMNIFG